MYTDLVGGKNGRASALTTVLGHNVAQVHGLQAGSEDAKEGLKGTQATWGRREMIRKEV